VHRSHSFLAVKRGKGERESKKEKKRGKRETERDRRKYREKEGEEGKERKSVCVCGGKREKGERKKIERVIRRLFSILNSYTNRPQVLVSIR
jgi:hypothetical protein